MQDENTYNLNQYEMRQDALGDVDTEYEIQQILTTEEGQDDVLFRLQDDDKFLDLMREFFTADSSNMEGLAALGLKLVRLAESHARELAE